MFLCCFVRSVGTSRAFSHQQVRRGDLLQPVLTQLCDGTRYCRTACCLKRYGIHLRLPFPLSFLLPSLAPPLSLLPPSSFPSSPPLPSPPLPPVVSTVAENSSFAVYSCSCYSSCRFNGKPAPPMMIVFSLMHVGEPHITL